MLHVTYRFITLCHQNDYILNRYTVSEQDISLGISSFIISNIYTVFTTRRRRKKENLYSFRLPPATSFFRNLSFTALKQTKLRHVISINTERNLFQTEVQKLAKAIFCSFCQLLEPTLEIIWSVCSTMPSFISLLHSELFQTRSQWDSSQWSVEPSAVNLCMIGPQDNQRVTLSVKFIISLSKCTCKQRKPILPCMFLRKGMHTCKANGTSMSIS